MRISDMPEFRDKSDVLTFKPTDTLATAIAAMSKKNYGAVLITDKDKLVGIFTERDLLRRVAAENMDLKKTKLQDVMTKKLKTAKIDDNVTDSLRRMSQGRFRHMPVIDENDKIMGMLSQGDFVAYTLSDLIYRAGVSAKANVDAGNSTPISILLAVLVYTIMIVILFSAVEHWGGF